MFRPVIYFAHWIDSSRMEFSREVHIYNVHAEIPWNLEVYNVLNIANEPEPTRMPNKKVKQIAPFYNLILTWDEDILSSCSNAVKFYCGMTWINKEDIIHVQNKRFEVSTFCGTKNMAINHIMRHNLWFRQLEIVNIPIAFFNSSHNPMPNINNNPLLGPEPVRKIDMFYSQYHITIENSCYRNYFTEKLMDCFMTCTIPIYVGCPNIGDFFDIDGMLIVNKEEEIIDLCNGLDPSVYDSKRESIENNFNLCQQYCVDFTDRLNEVLLKYVT